MLAQYDQLNNARITSSMVRPVGLIDDVKSQSQAVDNTLNQFKDFANDFGKGTNDVQQAAFDAQAFHDLVMIRGRE